MKKLFLLSLMAMLLPLSMWAQDDLTVKVLNGATEASAFEYNGTETLKSLNVKVYAGETELTLENPTQYYLVYTDASGEEFETTDKLNVGTYTVTAFGQTREYDGHRGSATFTVTPKQLTKLTLVGANIEYGTPIEEVGVSEFVTEIDGLVENTADEKENALKCLYLQRVDEGDPVVGQQYRVLVRGKKDNTESNYSYVEDPKIDAVYMTIVPRYLKVSLTENTKVYDGETIEPATDFEGKYTIGGSGVIEGDDVQVTFTCNRTIKDVYKNYPIRYTFTGADADKYVGPSDNRLYYTITRAKLSIKANEGLGKTYDGKDAAGEDITKYFTITTGVDGETAETLNLKMIAANVNGGEVKNVGKYTANPSVDGTTIWKDVNNGNKGYLEPVLLPNYWIDYDRDNTIYEVKKAEVTYYFASKGKVYDAEAVTTLTEGKEGDYQLVYKGFAKGEDFAADGKPVAAFDKKYKEVKNVDTYDLVNTTEEIKSDGDVENYTFTLLAADEVEDVEEGVSVNVYEITQAKATIKVKDVMEINFGATQEDIDAKLKDWATYLHTDISIANDADRGIARNLFTLELSKNEDVQAGKSGTYKNAVVITFKAVKDQSDDEKQLLENYQLTSEHGTLVILGKTDLVLDGSIEDETVLASIQDNDGALVENVTIKKLHNIVTNDNTLYTDAWYTLVLPFEVNVWEISEAFGYAIVNVPNYANSNEKKVVYNLTMGKVPANTLMLFKVDRKQTWNDDYTYVFKQKTIVAPTEWRTDGANNKFVGVYNLTTIDQPTQFYAGWDGKFYDAETDSQDIYPLNGYIETVSPEARIFVEDADGTVTAINAVNINKANAAEGWYTVGGVKLNAEPTEKGVYINNGKKVVIK